MGGLLRKLVLVREPPPYRGRRIAILLDSLTPRLREQIFRGLGRHHALALREYSGYGFQVPDLERMEVLAGEVRVKLTPQLMDQPDLLSHLTASWQAVAESDPAKCVERFNVEMEGHQKITIGEALEAIRVTNDRTRVTAIVLDSLSPAVAESVRRHLTLSELRSIKNVGRYCRAQSEQRRHRVLCFWLELDPTQHEIESVRIILQTAAASNPKRFAARSSEPWPVHQAPPF